MRLSVLVISLWLSACSQTNNFHEFELSARSNVDVISPKIIPPEVFHKPFNRQMFDTQSIFDLSDNQRKEFLAYFHAPSNRATAPHMRVAEYLEESTFNFTYKGQTFNASEAFTKQSGNCLSLAILSTAITELAGLPFKYKKVHSAPIFSESGDIQFVSSHVNLTVYNNESATRMKLLVPSSVTIDYFQSTRSITGSTITKEEIIINFWHNLASEAIANSNYNLGFSYTMMANDVNPLHPETLNLLAILYTRVGFPEKAYQVYDFMDNNEILSYTSLDNFASILNKKGEIKRANALWQKIENINDDNPYTWLYAAKKQLKSHNFPLAERYLLTSLALAPYLHETHFNLAKVYVQMSNTSSAKNSLQSAFSLASLEVDQLRYEAKLYSLSDK